MSASAIEAASFLALAAVLIGLGILALFMIGLERLSGSAGIARDGLRAGSRAPAWRQPDLDGVSRAVPDGRWKFLVFADHSLRSFPELVDALNRLHQPESNVDVIVASRAARVVTQYTFRALGLRVPTVEVDLNFYRQHRVRVMPFGTVIDPVGIVQAAGLISSRDTLLTTWRLGYLRPLLVPVQQSMDGRRGSHPA